MAQIIRLAAIAVTVCMYVCMYVRIVALHECQIAYTTLSLIFTSQVSPLYLQI